MDERAPARPLREGRWALAAGVIVCAIFVAPSLGRSQLEFGDSSQHLLPGRSFIGERLSHGELPLWNPRLGIGAPVAADPANAVFYPTVYLYALMPATPAQAIEILLHLALAFAFAFLYARATSLARLSAALAAASYVLSGYVIAHQIDRPIICAMPWLPAAALALQHFRIRRGYHYLALGGLAVGLAVLAGHLPSALAIGLALTLHTTIVAVQERSWRQLLGLAVVLIVGIGIGSLQLLPVLAVHQAMTGPQLSPATALATSLGPHELLALAFPHPRQATVFVGIVPLVLGTIAVVRMRHISRPMRAWVHVAAAAFVLMLGDYTPLFRWLRQAPLGGALGWTLEIVLRALPLLLLFLIVRARMSQDEQLAATGRRVALLIGLLALIAILLGLSYEPFIQDLVAREPLWGPLSYGADHALLFAFACGQLAAAGTEQLAGSIAPGAWRKAVELLRHRGSWLVALAIAAAAGLPLLATSGELTPPSPPVRDVLLQTVLLAVVGLLLAAVTHKRRLALPLILLVLFSDSWTFNQLHPKAATADRAPPPDGAPNPPKGSEVMPLGALELAARGDGRLWIERLPDGAARRRTFASAWPNGPTGATSAAAALGIWGPYRPAAYARALGNDAFGRLTRGSPTYQHALISLLGARTVVVSNRLWATLSTMRGKPGGSSAGPTMIYTMSATRPPRVRRAVRVDEHALVLAATPETPVAMAANGVKLRPDTCYDLELALSSSAKPSAPLRAEIKLGPYRQVIAEIPAAALGSRRTTIHRSVVTGKAPPLVYLRIFSRSTVPIEVHRARLSRCSGPLADIAALLREDAHTDATPVIARGAHRGPELVRATEVGVNAYHTYELQLVLSSKLGPVGGAVHLDLFGKGYDSEAQQLTVQGSELRREPKLFSRAIDAGPIPPRVRLRLITASSAPIKVHRAALYAHTPAIYDAAGGRTDGSGGQKVYREVDTAGGMTLAINRGALPRAWLVKRALPVRSAKEAVKRLPTLQDLRITALVEGIAAPRSYGSGRFRWLAADRANALALQVDAEEAGLLVVRDLHFPGWKVTVDRKPARLLRADGLLRAVEVPAGRSLVLFQFEHPGLAGGISRALGAMAICFALLVIELLRRRRRVSANARRAGA